MGNDTPKLTDDQVLEHASQGLDAHLPVAAEGYKCTTEVLLHVLLVAAARRCTIESACAELDSGPGAETVALRGLGPERTLVLIDGRRIGAAGTFGGAVHPDLSLIPTFLVSRAEILLSGARHSRFATCLALGLTRRSAPSLGSRSTSRTTNAVSRWRLRSSIS